MNSDAAKGLFQCNLFSDLSPLAELTSLQRLTLFNAQIDDITALSNLIEIGSLDPQPRIQGGEARARITDISALAGMTKLRSLGLAYHAVSDLSVLANGSVSSPIGFSGGTTLATFQVLRWE